MFERFSDLSRRVMAYANLEAQRLKHDYVAPEHMLLGIAKDRGCIGGSALGALGADYKRFREEIGKVLSMDDSAAGFWKQAHSDASKQVITFAIDECRQRKQTSVNTGHILLGIVRAKDGASVRLLEGLGLTPDAIRAAVDAAMLEQQEET